MHGNALVGLSLCRLYSSEQRLLIVEYNTKLEYDKHGGVHKLPLEIRFVLPGDSRENPEPIS